MPQYLAVYITFDRMKTLCLVALLCVFAQVALAHREMSLPLSVDGSLSGLPKQYSNARVRYGASTPGIGARTELSFSVNNRKTEVLPCLLRLVPVGSLGNPTISGSWYHSEDSLPHYVVVRFRVLESASNSEFSLPVDYVFSLRDASLLHVVVDGRFIDLHRGCPAEARK